MPNVTNIEVFEGHRPAASPASKIISTTIAPVRTGDEVAGHYATSRVVKCWSCGGLSYAVADEDLTNQMFTCPMCGQANQL